MDKSALVSAILSGKKEDLVNVLPTVTHLSHTEIEKSFRYLCENAMPAGSPYRCEPRLRMCDLPDALRAFDTFFLNSKSKRQGNQISAFTGMDADDRALWYRLYDFLKNHYNTLIEPDRISIGFKPMGGVIKYYPYKR